MSKEKIINDFARKIQPFYELLNWQWDGVGIPSQNDIKKTIKNFFEVKNLSKPIIAKGKSGRL